ncbi:sensor histidine kinase [Nocardioides mangrovi]|uniref:histidine kinase n=1 Tax=Nocardioides mangrovi TaxID=2874580 RepID=A0ABS7U7M0_9ACTN|nr:ATP-binding protein [Nocardioides mangrovi]MBZ5736984.1 HAMP domain-containing histidine kinase [Nocardioides mangrovi]
MTAALGLGDWPDGSTHPVLELLVDAIAEMGGFARVTLAIAEGTALVPVAYAGPPGSSPTPLGLAPEELAVPAGGRLLLVPGDGDLTGEAWQSGDLLIGVLTEVDRVIGVIRCDDPHSGRRPDPAVRRVLERCFHQTERTVANARERLELREQFGYAEAARRLVRSALAPAHPSLEAVLEHAHRPLVEGFHATGSWIEVLDPAAVARGYARARDSAVVPLPDDVIDLCHEVGLRLWLEQQSLVVEVGAERPEDDAAVVRIRDEVRGLGLGSVLAVPLGAGPEYFGFLALGRRTTDPAWSAIERSSAVQIGYDLGAALRTASALEGQRALVRELQQLDDYRSQLIATLSHELRTPLTVIAGNLEMLGSLEIGEIGARHHRAMTRGATRMQRVVDDLLLLATVSDPQHPVEEAEVDLAHLVREVAALVATPVHTGGLALDVDLPSDPLVVTGSPSELDRLVGNLLSNAVKYTEPGGTVAVRAVHEHRRVVLTVADTGIGIGPDDLEGLFRAFYRTSNPDALRHPGTGLGLAIVATIAERHGGTVAVASELGRGTTFTVTIPAR